LIDQYYRLTFSDEVVSFVSCSTSRLRRRIIAAIWLIF